jgi:hypothetical protein
MQTEILMLQCLHCGAYFFSSRVRKHCTHRCAQRHGERLRNLRTAAALGTTPCEVCSVEFPPLREDRPQRTCSRACSQILKTRERAAAKATKPKRASKCKQCRAKDRQGLSDYCSQECKDCRKRQDRLDREYRAPGLSVRQRYALLQEWKRSRSCTYCNGPCETVDHIVPLVLGGTNHEGNLTPACRGCNSSKGGKLIVEWRFGGKDRAKRSANAA